MKSTNFYLKFLIVMLISITFQMDIISQNYHPLIRSNTYWDVMKGDSFEPCIFYSGGRYFFEGDTILDGLHYNIVRAFPILSSGTGGFCEPYEVDGDSSYIAAFMREDTIAKKVFIYDQLWGGDNLIYDFSLDVNDTLFTIFNYPLWVDSIRYVTLLNGEQRKIFHFYNYDHFYYIEGIGGSMGLCYPLELTIDHFSEPGCVMENDVPLLNLGQQWGIDCYPYVGLNELRKRDRQIIFPNPVTNVLYLTTHGDSERFNAYEIYNLSGLKVAEGRLFNNSYAIPVDYLGSGMYLLRIKNELNAQNFKFIKK